MRLFGANATLALIWAAALGEISLPNLLAGFAIGFVVLASASRLFPDQPYASKCFRVVEFVLFFAAQLLLSSLRVAADIVTPTHRSRPGIVAVPLDAKTDAEITLLANLISLTPGSLSLDLSTDRKNLFVHVMFLDDAQRFREEVKEGFERRVLELLR